MSIQGLEHNSSKPWNRVPQHCEYRIKPIGGVSYIKWNKPLASMETDKPRISLYHGLVPVGETGKL